jgi:hypothetical protein
MGLMIQPTVIHPETDATLIALAAMLPDPWQRGPEGVIGTAISMGLEREDVIASVLHLRSKDLVDGYAILCECIDGGDILSCANIIDIAVSFGVPSAIIISAMKLVGKWTWPGKDGRKLEAACAGSGSFVGGREPSDHVG